VDLKLAYGMHNGRLRYIDDVELRESQNTAISP
jgi:hypothetical protein